MSCYIREPSFSGFFYPDNSKNLVDLITNCFNSERLGPKKLPPSNRDDQIFGAIVPHAAYVYSGAIAAHVYYAISCIPFENIIIICPNHSGVGSNIALMKNGYWRTPMGKVIINSSLSSKLISAYPVAEYDILSHLYEHGIEVQLPFLQYIKKTFSIVPISIKMNNIDVSSKLGEAIALLLKESQTFIIASSDFSHYAPHDDVVIKDSELIDSILNLDVERFYSIIERYCMTVCGYGAIATLMSAVKHLGCNKGTLLKYATSGDIYGDYDSVVGYSSIVFT